MRDAAYVSQCIPATFAARGHNNIIIILCIVAVRFIHVLLRTTCRDADQLYFILSDGRDVIRPAGSHHE